MTKCGAKTKTGTPCKRFPMHGRKRCAVHSKTGGNPQQKQQQGWESIYLPQQQQQRLAEKSRIIWKYLMENPAKNYYDGEKYYNKLMQTQYQDKMKRKHMPKYKTSSFI